MQKYLILFILPISLVFGFGKNKVQYHDFHWQYLETNHFRVYFYEGGKELAKYCLKESETAYSYIKRDLYFNIKNKIDIIVYNSHNHFEETNVMGGIPQESVGGFTEFFKNRVVVPFDGSWESFRHVIHHELTHAIQNQMMFGQNLKSISTSISQMNMPLWFIEGLAEYQSRGGWDSESDMFLRDAVYHEYLPQIYSLSNMAYKGGQSMLYFISQNFGHRKIGDILRNMSLLKSYQKAFAEALGMSFQKLSSKWHRWYEEKYSKSFQKTKPPNFYGDKLTDHINQRNFINNSPAISPDGKIVAFISNKDEYFDIFLMRTFDGKIIKKLISGQGSGDFEEFHWLRPGISWSSDNRHIAFATKSGDQDQLFIYDVNSGNKIISKKFNMDGLYSPSWAHKSNKICFLGLKNGRTNLYLYDMDKDKLEQLTDDIFSLNFPRFNQNDTKIIFDSDRNNITDINFLNYQELYLKDHNISNIYSYDISSKSITRLTKSSDRERFPFFINDSLIGYISDANGIDNIYIKNLNNQKNYPVSNLLTGLTQPHFSNNRLVFTALFKGGYDIYYIDNFQELIKTPLSLDNYKWYPRTNLSIPLKQENIKSNFQGDISKITFSQSLIDAALKKEKPKNKNMLLYETYTPRFSPDIITVNAGYSNGYGFMGSSYVQISDKLGDHRIILQGNLSQNIINSNIYASYFYLKQRINYGVAISHNLNHYLEDVYLDSLHVKEETFRDRLWGMHLLANYPLDRYKRFDTGFNIKLIDKNLYIKSKDDFKHKRSECFSNFKLGFSYDSSLWGMVGPVNGTRFKFETIFGFDNDYISWDRKGAQFHTARIDYRKYLKISGRYRFAFRFAGGISGGKTPQQFYIGGVQNWINARINRDKDFLSSTEKYYSYLTTPARGFKIFEKNGNKFFQANLEFRYPFIEFLALGFPFPIRLGNIMGTAFIDVGSAWTDKFQYPQNKNTNDLLTSWGFGTQMHLGYFILRYDLAWRWNYGMSKPNHLVSLGANF